LFDEPPMLPARLKLRRPGIRRNSQIGLQLSSPSNSARLKPFCRSGHLPMTGMARQMMEATRLLGQSGAHAGTLANSSEELIRRARNGDDEAFRLIFERYIRPIISFIFDMVGRRELAEDLAQETFVRAYKNLNALRDETRLSTWLFGIAKNVARESLRARIRDDRKVELDQGPALELSDEL